MDPAVAWRGPGSRAPAPPEPWPGRHEDFLTACAVFAGRREKELISIIEALGSPGESAPAPKQWNPMRAPGSG